MAENREQLNTDVSAKNGYCERKVFTENGKDGTVTLYKLLPGIELHCYETGAEYSEPRNLIPAGSAEIHYCTSGRTELCSDGRFYFSGKGEALLHRKGSDSVLNMLPDFRYSGISLFFDFNEKSQEFTDTMERFSIDLDYFRALCREGVFYRIDPNGRRTMSLLEELAQKHEEMTGEHLLLKAIELLLAISGERDHLVSPNDQGYSGYQAQTVRELRNYIIDRYDEHHTVDELSVLFHFSPTSLKQWFRGVYGMSIYSYLKLYRLYAAKEYLDRNDASVSQTALYVGYENPSKFSAAFRDEFGLTPKAYKMALKD